MNFFSVNDIHAYRHFSEKAPFSLFEMKKTDWPGIGETYK